MPAQERSGSPLDFDHEAYRLGDGAAGVRRFAREGVRTFHTAFGGSGVSDTVRLGDGALLTVVNCVLPALTRWRYDTDEAHIMLRASLSCDVAFRINGMTPMVFNRPEVTLVCLPPGQVLTVDIAGGARQQGLIAVFRAADFAARHGLRNEDLPAIVRNAVSQSSDLGRIAAFPLDHRIAALIADTLDTRLDGELRVLQLMGRVAELVAFTLDAIEQTPTLRGAALNRQRDVELAHQAIQRLQAAYRRPPSFTDLALEIGTNQNKLKAVFKEAFGTTMSDYCLERRMREAQQLLLEAKLTIAQVAERVGYEHQSSFTAAFRSHVGLSPREYRQHRAPFSRALVAPADTKPG